MRLKTLTRLLRDESGVTAIEYGIIASLVAIAALTAMRGLGTKLSSNFSTVASNLS